MHVLWTITTAPRQRPGGVLLDVDIMSGMPQKVEIAEPTLLIDALRTPSNECGRTCAQLESSGFTWPSGLRPVAKHANVMYVPAMAGNYKPLNVARTNG